MRPVRQLIGQASRAREFRRFLAGANVMPFVVADSLSELSARARRYRHARVGRETNTPALNVFTAVAVGGPA